MAKGNPNFTVMELNIEDLTQDTRYRFAELELNQAINNLKPFFVSSTNPRVTAAKQIIEAVAPHLDEQSTSAFFDILVSYSFVNPTKQELIHYFRYNGASYKKITELTSISPNTISAYRYDVPYFIPIFQQWEPAMFSRWQNLKPHLNLWNERLIHFN
jgi:hypothetical protein